MLQAQTVDADGRWTLTFAARATSEVVDAAIAGARRRRDQSKQLGGLFPLCASVANASRFGFSWDDLCGAYMAVEPSAGWTAERAARGLPSFVRRTSPAAHIPDWFAELADFEWQVARERTELTIAHREASGDAGFSRLAPGAILRLYAHDLVAWIAKYDRQASPQAVRSTVLFWRDAAGRTQARVLDEVETDLVTLMQVDAEPGGARAWLRAVDGNTEFRRAYERLCRVHAILEPRIDVLAFTEMALPLSMTPDFDEVLTPRIRTAPKRNDVLVAGEFDLMLTLRSA